MLTMESLPATDSPRVRGSMSAATSPDRSKKGSRGCNDVLQPFGREIHATFSSTMQLVDERTPEPEEVATLANETQEQADGLLQRQAPPFSVPPPVRTVRRSQTRRDSLAGRTPEASQHVDEGSPGSATAAPPSAGARLSSFMPSPLESAGGQA